MTSPSPGEDIFVDGEAQDHDVTFLLYENQEAFGYDELEKMSFPPE